VCVYIYIYIFVYNHHHVVRTFLFHTFPQKRKTRGAITFSTFTTNVTQLSQSLWSHGSSFYIAMLGKPAWKTCHAFRFLVLFKAKYFYTSTTTINSIFPQKTINSIYIFILLKKVYISLRINIRLSKYFWDLLKVEVLKFYVEYHHNCRLIKGINITFIVFILKFDRP